LKSYRQVAFSRFQTITRSVSIPLDIRINVAEEQSKNYEVDQNERDKAKEMATSLKEQRHLLSLWQTGILERISTISNKDEQEKLLSEINDKERELC
jgi:predicted glycosyl hydrolase (DUF1957 family)